jgi:hypothetical protein
MKFRLTILATALTVLAIGPAYAGGAGGCDYGSKYKYTSAEPQEQSEASRKLASLNVPATDQEAAVQAAPEKPQADTTPTAETPTTR